LALGRIMAGIRVIGDQTDEQDAPRPQHRAGFRGPYTLRAAE
jgi:hypothetical protein